METVAEETAEVVITCYRVLLGKFTFTHLGKEFGVPFVNGTRRSSTIFVNPQFNPTMRNLNQIHKKGKRIPVTGRGDP
jgi:hypothetical protein